MEQNPTSDQHVTSRAADILDQIHRHVPDCPACGTGAYGPCDVGHRLQVAYRAAREESPPLPS